MRVFGLLFTFQGAFSIDSVMSRFSYVTLHYLPLYHYNTNMYRLIILYFIEQYFKAEQNQSKNLLYQTYPMNRTKKCLKLISKHRFSQIRFI